MRFAYSRTGLDFCTANWTFLERAKNKTLIRCGLLCWFRAIDRCKKDGSNVRKARPWLRPSLQTHNDRLCIYGNKDHHLSPLGVCLSTVHLQNRSPLVLSTSEWGGRWRSMDWVLYWRCRRSRWVLGAPRKSCCRGPTYHRSNTRPKMTGLYRRRRKDEEHEWTQTTPPELADVVHSSQDCHTSHQNLI